MISQLAAFSAVTKLTRSRNQRPSYVIHFRGAPSFGEAQLPFLASASLPSPAKHFGHFVRLLSMSPKDHL